jgi:hypothetical protein
MSNVVIPAGEWKEFLDSFAQRHQGWLVRMEVHDRQTEEDVSSQFVPLCSLELDTEDPNNPRINVTCDRDHKLIKHVLFRPYSLVLCLFDDNAEESLCIQSLNTSTTLRFRAA